MKIKTSKYDLALEILCLLLLISVTFFLIFSWNTIPDKIPGHYNTAGVVDRWGNKGELIFLPVVAWLLYLGMTAVAHFPQIWNTGVTVTQENKERVYRILKDMLVTMKLLVVAVFTYLTIHSAGATALPAWFLPLFIVAMFGSMAFFIVRLVKAK